MNVVECQQCGRWFNNVPAVAGVCPSCGHENNWLDDLVATTH